MERIVKTKIYRGGGGKYYLYLPRYLVEDPSFPFSIDDRLEMVVFSDVVVVRRATGRYPGVGPFILGLYSTSVKNAEVAERLLREKWDELTEEQRTYLRHVVEEGLRNREVYNRLIGLWEAARRSSGKPPKA